MVSSEKQISNNIEKERFTKKEFSYAKFKRTFTLPENIEKELIEASYRSGILSLELPKRKEELKITKQIQVK